MKERPIIFSSEMVLAILRGRKTQSRRLRGMEDVNHYPGVLTGDSPLGPLGYRGLEPSDYLLKPSAKKEYKKYPGEFHWFLGMSADGREINPIPIRCPYGQPGGRLWVWETWMLEGADDRPPGMEWDRRAIFKATNPEYGEYFKWRPSIHMPRWASRITLEITNVRVERLLSISRADARAEGASPWWLGADGCKEIEHGYEYSIENVPEEKRNYRRWFQILWDSINAKRGYGWNVNPYVWVIEFERVQS
jgi:hypothetical protein